MSRRGSKIQEENLRSLYEVEINEALNKLRPNKDIEQAKRLLNKIRVLIDRQCWIIRDDWSEYTVFENTAAHRLSYELFVGITIKNICHKCDRKGCINYNHFFQGTNKDNIEDYKTKRDKFKMMRRYQAMRYHDESGGLIATNPNKIIKPRFDFS